MVKIWLKHGYVYVLLREPQCAKPHKEMFISTGISVVLWINPRLFTGIKNRNRTGLSVMILIFNFTPLYSPGRVLLKANKLIYPNFCTI